MKAGGTKSMGEIYQNKENITPRGSCTITANLNKREDKIFKSGGISVDGVKITVKMSQCYHFDVFDKRLSTSVHCKELSQKLCMHSLAPTRTLAN